MPDRSRPGAVRRRPAPEQVLLPVMRSAYDQAYEDLAMVLALYRQNLATSNGDQVLAFGLVEAALAQNRFGDQRTNRALTAAAARLARLETETTRLISGRA